MQEFRETKTVAFFGTVPANSERTYVSDRISTPFRTLEISAHFALNTNRTLQEDFYVSLDDSAPTSGRPSGTSLLREYGQVAYITGDDETKRLRHQTVISEGGSYLKVYANNTDSFEHTVDVQITIEPLPRE